MIVHMLTGRAGVVLAILDLDTAAILKALTTTVSPSPSRRRHRSSWTGSSSALAFRVGTQTERLAQGNWREDLQEESCLLGGGAMRSLKSALS